MDAKPTEIVLFHIFKSKQINFIATRILDLKSLKIVWNFKIIYDIDFDHFSSQCKIKS